MLKRPPSLTEQVKTVLKQRILNEEFDDGRIPSESDLADELGVSRTTIRDALSRLEIEGTVNRRPGVGTFINEAGLQIKIRLEEIWNYEAMLEAHGYVPTSRILGVKEETITASTAVDLNLPPNEKILVVQKLFLADGRPVILGVNRIPTRLISRTWTPDDFHLPIYQFLAEFCQQNLAHYISEIVPLIAQPWLMNILNLSEQKAAIISFDEIGYNQENRPVIRTCSYFRDDLLRLRLIRREAQ
jgi:GntR family transcriptional regulator